MRKIKALLVAAVVVVGLGSAAHEAVAQDDFIIVDGHHWQQLDEAQRVAFVSGMMHVVEFEKQLKGDAAMADEQSFVPHLVSAVDGHTVGEVSVAVTEYYVAHPDDLDRPVIATVIHVYTMPAM